MSRGARVAAMRVTVAEPSDRLVAYALHHKISVDAAARELIGVGLEHSPIPKRRPAAETTIRGFAKEGEARR